jgi:hypothetical protein
VSDRVLSKTERASIFEETLSFLATNKHLFRIMSSVNNDESVAFDKLINRLNRTANRFNKNAIIICDEG